MIRRLASTLLLGFVFSGCGAEQVTYTSDEKNRDRLSCSGIWASGGSDLFASDNKLNRVSSPDNRFIIAQDDHGVFVESRALGRVDLGLVIDPSLSEVVWSPDSRFVAINASDGGVVGTWTSHVFSMNGAAGPARFRIPDAVILESRDMPLCEDKEVVNIATIGWSNEGDLILAAEVPPHSSCKNMGEIVAFKVSMTSDLPPGQLKEDVLRDDFNAMLGCRFKRD